MRNDDWEQQNQIGKQTEYVKWWLLIKMGWKEVGNLLGNTGLHFGIKNRAEVDPKPGEI